MRCEQAELPAPGSSEALSSLVALMLTQKAAKLEFSYKDVYGEVCPPCCMTLTVHLPGQPEQDGEQLQTVSTWEWAMGCPQRGELKKPIRKTVIGISDPVWLQLSPDLQLISTPTPALGQGANSTGCREDRSQDPGAPQVPSLLPVPVARGQGTNNGWFHFRLNRIFNAWN